MTLSRGQKVEQREREAQVLELRKAGASFPQIARALGYGAPSTAKRALDRAMLATIQETADEVRKLELERLDTLMKGLWPAAVAGTPNAVDRVLAIMDRRAKLLGLDMPTRTEVTVITEDAVDAEIRRLEAEIARAQQDA